MTTIREKIADALIAVALIQSAIAADATGPLRAEPPPQIGDKFVQLG